MMGKDLSDKAMRPFGMRDKIAYAMGDIGCNMSFALNSYLMLFYTQYIGLSITTWGVIILLLKIWDAINDPIMGGLMDSIKPGKRGKFKTYIYYGSFALIVSAALCFLPIPNAPTWIKIAVCVLGYLAWDMAYTVVNVPYGSFSSVITSDPVERAELSTWRSIGAMVANIAIMVALPMIIYAKKDSGETANSILGNRFIIVALVLGVIGFFAFRFLLNNSIERVKIVEDESQANKKYNYFSALGAFFRNAPAVSMTIASICQLIGMAGIMNCSQLLFQSYFKNAQISGVMSLISFLPSIVVIPFTKSIVRRYGKKEASVTPMLASIAAGAMMVFLPIAPTTTGMFTWMALTAIYGLGQGIFMVVGWAMVADCIDYQQMVSGKREEGTVYAIYSLGRKLAQGFGASIIAFLLAAVGYESTLGANQTAQTAANIKIVAGSIQLVSILVMYLVLQFGFKLNKKQVDDMQIKLGRVNSDVVEVEEV
ncbi:MAG: glycoside-pentoside-hexuronide (GPH):cation symporter [Clostridia bacterium]